MYLCCGRRRVDALRIEGLLVGGEHHSAACPRRCARLRVEGAKRRHHAKEADDFCADSDPPGSVGEYWVEFPVDPKIRRHGGYGRNAAFLSRVLRAQILGLESIFQSAL